MTQKKKNKPFGFLANVKDKDHNANKNGWSSQSAWNTGEAPAKECTECSFSKERGGYAIRIHPDVFGAIFRLCETVKEEWQMLLSGGVQENLVFINGYYIPKQQVTASSVKNLEAIDKEFIDENSIVATIHSHSTMGVFFSATDDEFTNMSFIQHHIVVNNKGDFVAKSRIDLPCGMMKFVPAKVETLIPTSTPLIGEDKIEIRRFVPTHVQNDQGWRNNDYTPPAHHNNGYRAPYQEGRKHWADDNYIKDKRGIYVHKTALTPQEREDLGVMDDDYTYPTD